MSKEFQKRAKEINEQVLYKSRLEMFAPELLKTLESLLGSLELSSYPESKFDLAFQTQIAYRKQEAREVIKEIKGIAK